jgi:hypothetical protein
MALAVLMMLLTAACVLVIESRGRFGSGVVRGDL